MAQPTKTKIEVYVCEVHGEQELVDYKDPIAYCPHCGRQMVKKGEYYE